MAPEYESGHGDKPVLYRAGQYVICKVVSRLDKTPKGYFVNAVKTGEHGFLQTTADLSVDAEVIGFFVCWAGGSSYMLLTLAAQVPQRDCLALHERLLLPNAICSA